MKYSEIKEIARKLRNNPTPSEEILWQRIRKDKIGRRILRQHPIIYQTEFFDHYFFIPDFYCASSKLVIELDGRIHDYQKDRDKNRDEILKHFGLKIIRIRNEELNDIEKVIERIKKELI